VFDFDWSLIDQDSDRWIFEVLAPHLRRQMKTMKDTIQWTDLVAQLLREVHAEGQTREDIEGALKIIPFHPAMIRAIKAVKGRTDIQTTFFCLSNANEVFIKTILESKGLQNFFDAIVTNTASWEPSGLLNLRRRVDPNGPQHACKVGCSPNMCKGEELTAFLDERDTAFDRIIYVGDGSNDFCPALRLRTEDIVFCRKHRGLQHRIAEEGGLKCSVQYWSQAWEAEEMFDKLQ